jgi:hypothetical protein
LIAPDDGDSQVITSVGAAGVGADAFARLKHFGAVASQLCYHKVTGDYPHHHAPLVMLALAAGPGSKVQRQLHSLLATIMKVSRCGKGTLGSTAWAQYLGAAAHAASALLVAATSGAVARASGHADAAAMLPFAVILGHCFVQCAHQLQEDPILFLGKLHGPCTCSSQEQVQAFWSTASLKRLVSVMQQWLAAGSTCSTSAAGYAPLPVLQQLEQLLLTSQALQDSPPDTAAIHLAAQQLQSTGLAICSFAVPSMCNNPRCTSMLGLSELATVSGRNCMCGGCRVAHYCGRACQRAAWKKHKPFCAALSAAAGDGGGTGAGSATAALAGAAVPSV